MCKEKKFFDDKGAKKVVAWRNLYNLRNEWYIQRYGIKDYCRIINWQKHIEIYGTVEQILCPILEHCHREELKEKISKKDWGIVFCGGGAKGSYQIGVWKWLVENKIADKITGVSGASVGALNSLLFVEGDCKRGEEIWYKVLSDIIVDKNVLPILQNQDKLTNFLETHVEAMKNICAQEKIVYSSMTRVDGFPWKALLGYLKTGIVPPTSTIKADYYCWGARDKKDIQEIVLASAAIPGIKKIRKFEGKLFVDGGLADNVPVRPLVEDGFRTIIVIHLNNKEVGFEKVIADLEETGDLDGKNVNFYHVRPSDDLGDMTKAGAVCTQKRIEQGYRDAANQLQELLNFSR